MSAWRRILVALAWSLAGCAIGPDYHRPDTPVSAEFKEAKGWKIGTPGTAGSGSDWWSVYNDPELDRLEHQIDISNQNLKAAEAAYRQASAVVEEARASFFPTTAVNAQVTRSGNGGGERSVRPNIGNASFESGGAFTTYTAGASASWVPDIWGKIRRTVESDVATAQATDDDLAAARLSAQASLATDYIAVRMAEELKQLLDDTIVAYQRSLQITRNQYTAGIVAKSDVITAETQLQSAQAEAINVGVQRAQMEHAVAILIGKPPADFSIVPGEFTKEIPVLPPGLPAALLERRPDVASAERKMAAANASIGIAIGAFFPDLTLSGSYGYQSSEIGTLFQAANNVWSVGPSLAETVFDAGARSAAVDAARASYDQSVATYRQTALTALQQVEDELASLRILADEAEVQEKTVRSAKEAMRLTLNEYKAGTVSYVTVVTAQAIELNQAQTLLTIRQNRLNASVALIQALGGGWKAP